MLTRNRGSETEKHFLFLQIPVMRSIQSVCGAAATLWKASIINKRELRWRARQLFVIQFSPGRLHIRLEVFKHLIVTDPPSGGEGGRSFISSNEANILFLESAYSIQFNISSLLFMSNMGKSDTSLVQIPYIGIEAFLIDDVVIFINLWWHV